MSRKDSMGVGRVWTDGFILLLQFMAGSVGVAVNIVYNVSQPRGMAIAALDLAVTLSIIAGLMWRYGLSGPPLWPALPAATPVVLLCLHQTAGGPLCIALTATVVVSRVYFAASSLMLIVDRSNGLILGADTTLVQLAIVASLVVVSGAALVYAVESQVPGSPIKSFGDAIWWALATATTVGYGDVVPVTTEGRIVASLLMLFGIGSFGVFISDMAARIARITILGIDGGSIVDRTKLNILRRLSKLEELDDAELEMLISQLRAIHAIERSSTQLNPEVVELFSEN